ncbi:MAG TPA: hypothetical protein VF475_16170 [Sphingobium sp.]
MRGTAPQDAEAARTARAREAMARVLCDLAGTDPDFKMWDGQPIWKWRAHSSEYQARIDAAIAVLKGEG